jgi:serine/threonine protein kinase
MEFLAGEGLEVRLKRERRLPISLVHKITSQLCKALHVAHAAGVIHRDLKPANVFLCTGEDGELLVKLLDFGVAKATQETDENQATRAGQLVGTPNYMSPEQILGTEALDPRSDLWAVAAIAYRMAVGRAPFGSGALSELAMRILSVDAPVPTTLAPDLPHEFDLWVEKGLAKKPPARFQTAKELSESLAMVAGESLGANATGTFSSAAAEALALQLGDSVGGTQRTLSAVPAPRLSRPAEPKRRSPALMIVGGLVGVAAVAGIAFVATRHPQTPTTQAAATPAPTTSSKASLDSSATPSSSAIVAAPSTPAPNASSGPASSASAAVAEPTERAAASKPVLVPHGGVRPVAGKKDDPAASAPTATAAPTASAAPVPTAAPTATAAPDLSKTSGDLWKKKDEM